MTSKKLPDWVTPVGAITSLDQFPKGTFGFVYCITFDNGRRYIGYKQLRSVRNVKKGKRELAAMTDKRGSKKKQVIKESNWKQYCGSSKVLKDNPELIATHREIVAFAGHKQQLSYLEAKFLFAANVLENDNYMNENISGKFYKKATLWDIKNVPEKASKE